EPSARTTSRTTRPGLQASVSPWFAGRSPDRRSEIRPRAGAEPIGIRTGMCALRVSAGRASRRARRAPGRLVARMYRSTRTIGIALAGVFALAASLAAVAPGVGNAAAPVAQATRVVGGTGPCTHARGALVAVSFRRWHGPIVRGCGLRAANGIQLLRRA